MGLRGGDLNMSPGRDAAGIKMPTLEGLLKHTHTHTRCMLIQGPSFPPGIAVPGDSGPSVL